MAMTSSAQFCSLKQCQLCSAITTGEDIIVGNEIQKIKIEKFCEKLLKRSFCCSNYKYYDHWGTKW